MFYRGVKSLKEKNVDEEFESLVQFINFYCDDKEEQIVFADFRKCFLSFLTFDINIILIM